MATRRPSISVHNDDDDDDDNDEVFRCAIGRVQVAVERASSQYQ